MGISAFHRMSGWVLGLSPWVEVAEGAACLSSLLLGVEQVVG